MSRTALVTGGASGIGRAIVQALGAEGHRVAVADVADEAAERTATEVGGMSVHMDVTDTDSVGVASMRVEQELGPVEILVNNAGWDVLRPFLETDEAFWRAVVELNFLGAMRTCRRLVPAMQERRYGRVINIGSDAARVGSSLEAAYSGAKGGVVSFTKTLAREVAREGVTANAVCPGPTETPLLEQMLAAGGETADTIEALRRAVPMRRLGQPEDVAGAVAFLASDRASFITGQTLSVSGGLTMV